MVLGDAAVDAVAASAFREHNTAQMLAADLPGGEGKARGARGGWARAGAAQRSGRNPR